MAMYASRSCTNRIKNAAHEKMKGFFQKLSAKKQGIFSKNKIDTGRPFS